MFRNNPNEIETAASRRRADRERAREYIERARADAAQKSQLCLPRKEQEPMPPTRLFHTILPIPECEQGHVRVQMRLAGNLHLAQISYECPACFRGLQVTVTFTEDTKWVMDEATKDATDTTA